MAQIVSAYPALDSYRVPIAVAAVFLIMLINLRGVRESGAAIAIPSYFFIVMLYALVGTGLFRYFFGSLGSVVNPPHLETLEPLAAITGQNADLAMPYSDTAICCLISAMRRPALCFFAPSNQ